MSDSSNFLSGSFEFLRFCRGGGTDSSEEDAENPSTPPNTPIGKTGSGGKICRAPICLDIFIVKFAKEQKIHLKDQETRRFLQCEFE